MARMIESLRISNLGVIADASVECSPGLTVLTGETGAGKTMVLTALGLLLGERADPALVRAGTAGSTVEAIFTVPADHTTRDLLDDAGAAVDVEGDQLVVITTRTVATQGKSRATLGGRTVPSAVLRTFTEPRIAVHGQADQWRLKRTGEQLAILDAFAGVDRSAYQQTYRTWQSTRQRLLDLQAAGEAAEQQARERAAGLADISAVDPKPGEDAELDATARALGHAVSILEDLGQAHEALVGTEHATVATDAMSAAVVSLRSLERVAAVDERAIPIRDAVRAVQDAIQEATAQLDSYRDGIDADPAHLERVEERRRSLTDLKRRFGPTLDDVLRWRDEALAADLDDVATTIARLTTEVAELEATAREQASAITAVRTDAAGQLGTAVTEELRSLALADAEFTVALESTDLADSGADQVVFLFTGHRGGSARPLAKGASGGELARVMLALEVVVADTAHVPTFVFDEVDAGIGGRAAVEVGRRLAALAERAQVLVVTHLPQVAAFADTHIVVDKTTSGEVTTTDVRTLDDQGRVDELVRMLSGLEESSAGSEHAREMLEQARRVVGRASASG
jgi:DNA repair protein RecN (Recombination protein N)